MVIMAIFSGVRIFKIFTVSKLFQDCAHCISIHPKVDIAAIGCSSGKWFALDLSSRRVIVGYEDAKEQVECISFSPGTVCYTRPAMSHASCMSHSFFS